MTTEAIDRRKRFVVVGNINVDHVVYVKKLPRVDEVVSGGELDIHIGGKGANQAVAISRLGGLPYMIGCVGNDHLADLAIEALERRGVVTSYICRSNKHTGTALIIVDSEGNKVIAVAPGANKDIKPEHVDAFLQNIDSEINASLIQIEIDIDTLDKILGRLKSKGISVTLTASPPKELPEYILRNIDILIANLLEAQIVAGVDSRALDLSSARKAAERLAEIINSRGVKNVVITIGSEGSVIYSASEGVIHVEPVKTAGVVDTTGAGDVYTATLTYALAEGYSLYSSALIASAAAAIKIRHRGAQEGIPTFSEAISFLKDMGIEI